MPVEAVPPEFLFDDHEVEAPGPDESTEGAR